ncbi:hypothetical protein KKI17_02460 [Patescibacteria group bacterium]|nr:hypothetical protein [Patescibacteria group bacterium]
MLVGVVRGLAGVPPDPASYEVSLELASGPQLIVVVQRGNRIFFVPQEVGEILEEELGSEGYDSLIREIEEGILGFKFSYPRETTPLWESQ